MLITHNELINYLVEVQEKKVKPLNRKEAFRKFIKEFNQESKRQSSRWFAEVHNKDDKDEFFHFLHISKKLTTGWIFKNIKTISLHIMYSKDGWFSFVDNDYSFSEYGDDKNKKIFKLLPEFKSILENIQSKVSILYNYKSEDFYKRFGKIEKQVSELEGKIL